MMVARHGTERDDQAFLYISRIDAKPAFGIRFLKDVVVLIPFFLLPRSPAMCRYMRNTSERNRNFVAFRFGSGSRFQQRLRLLLG
jgi:hypothetical protein